VRRSPCSPPELDGARQAHVLSLDRQTDQMLDILEHILPARSSPGRADSCVPQEAAGPRARRGVP